MQAMTGKSPEKSPALGDVVYSLGAGPVNYVLSCMSIIILPT